MSETKKTKKVRITLAALTRVEYTEVLEVPADMSQEELDALVSQRYDEVDGGLYVDDPHYWEPGNCTHEEHSVDDETAVNSRVSRSADGTFDVVNAVAAEDVE